MKSPREVLLKKHAGAEPKLDAITRRAVAGIEIRDQQSWFARACEAFALPKLGWSALAAAWVLIFGLNVASRDFSAPPATMARATRSEMIDALREQKRIYAELIGGGANADAAPRRFTPRPHSARRPETALA